MILLVENEDKKYAVASEVWPMQKGKEQF